MKDVNDLLCYGGPELVQACSQADAGGSGGPDRRRPRSDL